MSGGPPVLLAVDLSTPAPPARWPAGMAPVPFTAADAPAVHALMLSAYANGGGSVPRSFWDWWDATRTDEEFDPALCFMARTDQGGIAGFALCWSSSFVKDLVVHPAWRRRGVGEALLRSAQAALKARGHLRLSLKVESANDGARRLYERAGFLPA